MNILLKNTVFLFIYFLPLILVAQTQDILLPATWTFHKLHEPVWQPATVPGTVHTDLLRNKKNYAPFFQSNEKDLQYIENGIYEYEGIFNITEKQLSAKEIRLIFEGLDTYSQVKLNGKEILKSNNMFRTYPVAVKNLLKEGENTLIIRFFPAADSGKVLAKKNPHILPEKERVYTRKAQYQYGWDWGPRFVTCGIWRPVRLQCIWGTALQELHFVQKSLSEKAAKMEAHLIVFSQNLGAKKIELSDLGNRFIVEKEFALKPGKNEIVLPFEVVNPKFWYPNGYGEPYLYNFNVKILDKKTVEDIKNIAWGFRNIELVQEKDAKGRSFYFKVNGNPIFIKGANWIPAHSFPTEISYDFNEKDTEKANIPRLIAAAKEANMNMLRVWGGGYYEDDRFYKLCDENGILVWQDFMFACAMYPGDSLFIQNIENEFIDNVKRLRNHSCIALWCGNNEIEEGWFNWGWQKSLGYSSQDSQQIWRDYQAVFHKLIPEILAKYDGTRPYHPSSPANGWGREKAYTEGDVHYWGVWWGLEDFRKYQTKVGRFHSEYGMQAMPDYTTIQRFTEEKDRKLFSQVLKDHQKHPTGFKNLETYLQRDFPATNDLRNYTYLTQLLQAEAMKTAIEAHRLAKPTCMGTMYWQLNDCWSGISWSSVDFYGNWKAAHFAIKNAYNPILPIIKEAKDSIQITFVSDKIQPTDIRYQIDFQDFGGKNLQPTIQGEVSSIFLKTKSFLLPKKIDKKNSYVRVRIFYKEKEISQFCENFYYFDSPKNLNLDKKPVIAMELDKINPRLLHISANTLVKNLYLYQENVPLHLKENYFDLVPNEVKTIDLGKDILKVEDIKYLNINSLNN